MTHDDRKNGGSSRFGSWSLLRTRMGRIILLLVFIALIGIICGVVSFAVSTWEDVEAAGKRPELYDSTYQAADYRGKDAVAKILKTIPDGVDAGAWKPADADKADDNAVILPSDCMSEDTAPSSLLYARSASGSGLTTVAAVFGAGQAMKSYEDFYSKQVSSCLHVQSDDGSIWWDDGFITTRGDMMLSVRTSGGGPYAGADANKMKTLMDWYRGELDKVLSSSGCVSPVEVADDSKRSYYYDKDAYTGYFTSEKVSVDDHILIASVPQDLENNGMMLSAVFPSPVKNIVTPDAPLPDGMADAVPAAPAMQDLAAEPLPPSNEGVATYQAADTDGPGCGWSWSGQIAPAYDDAVLEKNRTASINTTKTGLSKTIAEYNASIAGWSQDAMLVMSDRAKWDEYGDQVNAVYASWADLTSKRDKFYPAWVQYVNTHNYHEQWIRDRASAEDSWNKSVESCSASNVLNDTLDRISIWNKWYDEELSDWHSENSDTFNDGRHDDLNEAWKDLGDARVALNKTKAGNDKHEVKQEDLDKDFQDFIDAVNALYKLSETAQKHGDVSIIPLQEDPNEIGVLSDDARSRISGDCKTSVKKPNIMTENAPADMTAPSIPDGVTVPYSWPQPE